MTVFLKSDKDTFVSTWKGKLRKQKDFWQTYLKNKELNVKMKWNKTQNFVAEKDRRYPHSVALERPTEQQSEQKL